jgi:hypothetical protein
LFGHALSWGAASANSIDGPQRLCRTRLGTAIMARIWRKCSATIQPPRWNINPRDDVVTVSRLDHQQIRGRVMQSVIKKSLAVLLTAGTIAAAAVTASTPAEARRGGHHGWGGHRGGAVAAGLIGGLALGAIATGAYGGYYGGYYGRPYGGYYGGPYYGASPYYASYGSYYGGPRCHLERRWVWTPYGERMRRVRVCY